MSAPAEPAAAAAPSQGSRRGTPVEAEAEETPKERTDRQLLELLNEVRVALPGAQFLFAFLLAVPFASRFASVSHRLQIVFYVCLLSTLAATILLMAPAVYHRIRWRQGNKTEVIHVAHRLFIGGMASLAIAMTTAVWFVSAFLFGTLESLVAAAVSIVLLALTWFALPLRARAHGGEAE